MTLAHAAPAVPIRPPGRRLGVLVSGRGSNLGAILDAIASGALAATVAVVASNRRRAAGLDIAREAGVPTEFLSHRAFRSRRAYDTAMLRVLRRHRVDVVCLAGFMRLVSGVLVRAFPNRILNVHPSLLPAFPGLHVHEQALERGVRVSGCTLHLVDEGMDTGPILLQQAVPVHDDDTPETLAARVLEAEHRLYPRALALLLDGRFALRGPRVVTTGRDGP